MRGRYDVAVKITFDSEDINLEDDKEIKFLKRVRHPRLVMFLSCGYVTGDGSSGPLAGREKSVFLVLEYCEAGTLAQLLYGTPPEQPADQTESTSYLSWRVRFQLLMDTAEGMAHLHLLMNTLHRDL